MKTMNADKINLARLLESPEKGYTAEGKKNQLLFFFCLLLYIYSFRIKALLGMDAFFSSDLFIKIVSFVLYLFVPILALLWLVLRKYTSFWSWALSASLFYGYFVLIYLAGAWAPTYGLLTRKILFVCFSIALGVSYLKNRDLFDYSFKKKWCSHSIKSLVLLSFLYSFVSITQSFKAPSLVQEIASPFRDGNFAVVQGGAKEELNHHHKVPAQKYALDILKVGKMGYHAKKIFPKKNTDYFIFGEPIYSPVSGYVIDVESEHEDLNPGQVDTKNIAGNYVVIDTGSCRILLAHLKQKSCSLKKRDYIEQGQYLGQVGNSGNTSYPHLHLHAVHAEASDYLFEGKGLPLTLEGQFLVRNQLIMPSNY